jgi:hypothetical protein
MKCKVFVLIAASLFAVNALIAQDYSNLDGIVLKEKADYFRNEDMVLECSDYLLNSAVEKVSNDLNHLKTLQFIMR